MKDCMDLRETIAINLYLPGETICGDTAIIKLGHWVSEVHTSVHLSKYCRCLMSAENSLCNLEGLPKVKHESATFC